MRTRFAFVAGNDGVRRLQELCGYSVYKGQFGHIDNRDPIELLGRERGKRMVWEATDAKKAKVAEAAKP